MTAEAELSATISSLAAEYNPSRFSGLSIITFDTSSTGGNIDVVSCLVSTLTGVVSNDILSTEGRLKEGIAAFVVRDIDSGVTVEAFEDLEDADIEGDLPNLLSIDVLPTGVDDLRMLDFVAVECSRLTTALFF